MPSYEVMQMDQAGQVDRTDQAQQMDPLESLRQKRHKQADMLEFDYMVMNKEGRLKALERILAKEAAESKENAEAKTEAKPEDNKSEAKAEAEAEAKTENCQFKWKLIKDAENKSKTEDYQFQWKWVDQMNEERVALIGKRANEIKELVNSGAYRPKNNDFLPCVFNPGNSLIPTSIVNPNNELLPSLYFSLNNEMVRNFMHDGRRAEVQYWEAKVQSLLKACGGIKKTPPPHPQAVNQAVYFEDGSTLAEFVQDCGAALIETIDHNDIHDRLHSYVFDVMNCISDAYPNPFDRPEESFIRRGRWYEAKCCRPEILHSCTKTMELWDIDVNCLQDLGNQAVEDFWALLNMVLRKNIYCSNSPDQNIYVAAYFMICNRAFVLHGRHSELQGERGTMLRSLINCAENIISKTKINTNVCYDSEDMPETQLESTYTDEELKEEYQHILQPGADVAELLGADDFSERMTELFLRAEDSISTYHHSNLFEIAAELAGIMASVYANVAYAQNFKKRGAVIISVVFARIVGKRHGALYPCY